MPSEPVLIAITSPSAKIKFCVESTGSGKGAIAIVFAVVSTVI